jgi:hypothetical protein
MDGLTYDSAAIYNRELERKQRKERDRAARWSVLDAQLSTAMPLAQAGDVAAMRVVGACLVEKHDVTVEERTVMPEGVAAFANAATRTIVVPPMTDAVTFAHRIHEIGHVLAGECSGREPHRRDPTVKSWTHCLKCETDAWEIAMRLVPFSRPMHDTLRSGLRTYRRTTPAPYSEVVRLERLSGTLAWLEDRQRRMKRQWMEQRQARVNAELGRTV